MIYADGECPRCGERIHAAGYEAVAVARACAEAVADHLRDVHGEAVTGVIDRGDRLPGETREQADKRREEQDDG